MAEDKKAINLKKLKSLNPDKLRSLNVNTGVTSQSAKARYKSPELYDSLNRIAQGTAKFKSGYIPPIFGKIMLATNFGADFDFGKLPRRTKSLNVNTGKRSYTNMKKGGKVKAKKPRDGRIKKAKGRDGIAQRGKTRGRMR